MKLFLLALLCASQASMAAKPNVLFILIDDFGWRDVGYNESTFSSAAASRVFVAPSAGGIG